MLIIAAVSIKWVLISNLRQIWLNHEQRCSKYDVISQSMMRDSIRVYSCSSNQQNTCCTSVLFCIPIHDLLQTD